MTSYFDLQHFLGRLPDQVRFIEELMQPKQLRKRILGWVHEAAQTDELPKTQ